MALINILISKDEIAKKAKRIMDIYTKENDSYLLELAPFLYALWSCNSKVVDQALALINQALNEYLKRGSIVYKSESMFPKIVSFALISQVFGQDRSDLIEKLKIVEIKDAKNKLIQEILITNKESNKSMFGHVNSVSKLYSKIKKWNFEYSLDITSCYDHPLWLFELSDFLIPIAFKLLEKKEDKSQDSFLNIINYHQLNDEVHVILQDENERKDIADVVILNLDSLSFIKWLGFNKENTISTDFLNNHEEAVTILKEKISLEVWDVMKEKIENNQMKYLILYDSSVLKLSKEKIADIKSQFSLEIEFSDFTQF